MIDFNDYLKKNFSEKEIKQIKERADKKSAQYIEFKNSLAWALKKYMKEKNLGFSEIKKELGTSDSQTSRLLKGETNFTSHTILKVGEVLGKTPRLIFE